METRKQKSRRLAMEQADTQIEELSNNGDVEEADEAEDYDYDAGYENDQYVDMEENEEDEEELVQRVHAPRRNAVPAQKARPPAVVVKDLKREDRVKLLAELQKSLGKRKGKRSPSTSTTSTTSATDSDTSSRSRHSRRKRSRSRSQTSGQSTGRQHRSRVGFRRPFSSRDKTVWKGGKEQRQVAEIMWGKTGRELGAHTKPFVQFLRDPVGACQQHQPMKDRLGVLANAYRTLDGAVQREVQRLKGRPGPFKAGGEGIGLAVEYIAELCAIFATIRQTAKQTAVAQHYFSCATVPSEWKKRVDSVEPRDIESLASRAGDVNGSYKGNIVALERLDDFDEERGGRGRRGRGRGMDRGGRVWDSSLCLNCRKSGHQAIDCPEDCRRFNCLEQVQKGGTKHARKDCTFRRY